MTMDVGSPPFPILEGPARDAVRYRGGHIQIIASAGSGKTEVVSQRVADLLADEVAPESIIAFTFTERAAEELKNRITQRVDARLGTAGVNRLGSLFVGTIHAFCFRLLQQRVPRYETYDVLDDNQLTAFLSREEKRLNIRQLDPGNRVFAAIGAFIKSVDVIENELLDPATIPDPLGSVLHDYYATLDRYRLLTYGQQIVRAVAELSRPEVAGPVHSQLRHLIVDEYQDVNAAQERLIELLTGPATHLCVVGDDQQAIYQWRGADVSNIVTFNQRYPGVAPFSITANRRSRPQIVAEADQFAQTIPDRLAKTMTPHRPPADGPEPAVVVWTAPTETEEAGWIANMILDLVEAGARFGDIGVLVRSRSAYGRLLEQFATFGIPVQPGGRSSLFEQPEALALGHLITWLTDIEWRDRYGRPDALVSQDSLLNEFERIYGLSPGPRLRLKQFFYQWKAAVPRTDRTADLVGELYDLFEELEVRRWDLTAPMTINRLGTLARFSALLADYESVRRRARPDPEAAGEQVGGEDRGMWYYRNLGLHIINYAQGAYDGFDGEADFVLDAVDLTTVHSAKGLEWAAVFVPSVTAKRFPNAHVGEQEDWLLPRHLFDAGRYEGSDADERRLFYVAMTRARDWLSVSRHERVTKQRANPSPYYAALSHLEVRPEDVRVPAIESKADRGEEVITVTYSELASYMDCGHAFRLRNLMGFQPRLAPELGYGKAVHHVLRTISEATKATGRVPSPADLDALFDASFFLPMANKAAHRQLKAAARRLVDTYTQHYTPDLFRVWETERPFELHLDGVTINGRADVILDQEGGVPTALAIVDYKTSTSGDGLNHALQLQVYADAGRREGLDVRAAYVHDLGTGTRTPVAVTPADVEHAERAVFHTAAQLKNREYHPNPGPRCRGCEVRSVCRERG